MKKEKGGYFSLLVPHIQKGTLYRFKVGKNLLADPASRCQPNGIDGPSCVIDPRFPWTDRAWKGLKMKGQSIYEIHIGTFTKEGTFSAAGKQLKELAKLGITTLLIMPIHTFPGRFGWGYDGVNLFAPMHVYGSPNEIKSFVNKAHRLGLGVILDVVYNHLGPEKNQLIQFSKDYLSRGISEWGAKINFDCLPVRKYCLTNARYWIEEYHFDGLRFDASSWITSTISTPILSEFSKVCKQGKKSVILIAENERQDSNLLRSFKEGGHAFDGLFNEDFQHATHVRLTGDREGYYTDYLGTPQELISLIKYGYLYQGQHSQWQQRNLGLPNLNLKSESLIAFLENHDQVGNTAFGKRLHQLSDLGNYKALVCFLLLGPNTPMIFQGQEFHSSKPFLYFSEHSEATNKAILLGRIKTLSKFAKFRDQKTINSLPPPSEWTTFNQSKLDFNERKQNRQIFTLFKDLFRLRKKDPVFKHVQDIKIDGSVLGPDSFILRFFGENEDRLLMINLGPDQIFDPCPEPLLVAGTKKKWSLLWSSESARYGGKETPTLQASTWKLPGHSAIVLKEEPILGIRKRGDRINESNSI